MVRKFTFCWSERLHRTADFDRVYSEGGRVASSALVVFFCRCSSESTRVGLSVSKRIGKSVARNRIKRLLREAFRLNKHRLKEGYDVLFVARAGIQGLRFRQVEALVLDLFRRAGLLVEGHGRPAGDELPSREG